MIHESSFLFAVPCRYIGTDVDVAMERVAQRNQFNPGWESLTMTEVRAMYPQDTPALD